MTVTGIELTKKGRYALMIDGEFAFSIHRDTYLLRDLHKDMEITAEALQALRVEDELRSARERALDYLSRSEQTTGTLRRKLLQWYSPEATEAALTRMTELGLLNDTDYSRRFAADGIHLKLWPLRRIAMELQKKGVAEEIITAVLAEYGEETDTETAARLLQKQYSAKLGSRSEREKTAAALMRRGFRSESVRRAMKAAEAELPLEEEPKETDDAAEAITALLHKKYAKNLTDRRGIEKTVAALYRRGFPLDEIRSAIKTVLEERQDLLQEEDYSDD